MHKLSARLAKAQCVSQTPTYDLQSGMHMNNCSTMSEFTPDASVVVASFVNEDGQQVGHQGGHFSPSSLSSILLYQCSQYL